MNLPRPLAALLAINAVQETQRNHAASDMLRRQWLKAIRELGAAAAAEDAAEVWTLRLGCSMDEGRAIVARAWRTLALP